MSQHQDLTTSPRSMNLRVVHNQPFVSHGVIVRVHVDLTSIYRISPMGPKAYSDAHLGGSPLETPPPLSIAEHEQPAVTDQRVSVATFHISEKGHPAPRSLSGHLRTACQIAFAVVRSTVFPDREHGQGIQPTGGQKKHPRQEEEPPTKIRLLLMFLLLELIIA
ncbi:hypothetical protein BDM02DRAFT_2472272 [Thelephora ganbajun]|uniref:Uncharacterized protein n=1 Tax=Thelephora ganbajun TaxID=370292 RepID=A0ACB6ZEA8_THEGA|nr:hypothetical protein BDM02DRAFT_2472272 [Thelephora ganbajun]